MIVPVTLAMTAAAAFLNVWLAVRIGRVRLRDNAPHGDAGNPLLGRRMRAHSNFVEYTPFVLLLILAIELSAGSSLWLLGAGLLYMLARVAHGIGMDIEATPNPWRAGGITVTMLVLIALAIWAVVLGYAATAGLGSGVANTYA